MHGAARPPKRGGGHTLAKVLLDAKVALPDIDAINEMSSFASLMLFSDIDSAALANHDDAHLTGILHLFLDLMGDIVSQTVDWASEILSG